MFNRPILEIQEEKGPRCSDMVKDIGDLVGEINGHQVDNVVLNFVTDKVVIHLYVFRVFVKDRIGGNLNGVLVITVESDR